MTQLLGDILYIEFLLLMLYTIGGTIWMLCAMQGINYVIRRLDKTQDETLDNDNDNDNCK